MPGGREEPPRPVFCGRLELGSKLEDMTVDRRRTERDRRAEGRVAAVFAVKSVVRGRVQLGQAEDIGAGGVCIRRPKELILRPGTPVSLTFALPGTGAFCRVKAAVVTDVVAEGFRRTGLRFLSLSSIEAQSIVDFCRMHAGTLGSAAWVA